MMKYLHTRQCKINYLFMDLNYFFSRIYNCFNKMVVIKNPEMFVLKGFEKSHLKDKKYNALLKNKKTGKIRRIPFGCSSYEHFKDKTKTGLWSHKDHKDKKRRELYRIRHKGEDKKKFSSGYFSMKYLW